MTRNGEDQLRLDINEASIEDDSSSDDVEYSPEILDLISQLKMTPEEMSTLEEQAGSLRTALSMRGASEEQINKALGHVTPELLPEPLPEVDMSNVKTSYSPKKVKLADRALHLIAAAEAASEIRPGPTNKGQRDYQDVVENEVYQASGMQTLVDSGDEDPFEAKFQGQMRSNRFIRKYGGPDKEEARDEFVRKQKLHLK